MTLDLAVAYKTPKGQAMKVKQNHIKIKKILCIKGCNQQSEMVTHGMRENAFKSHLC